MSGLTASWFLGMAMGSAIAFSANCASAQITPDGTLPNNSIVTPDGSTLNITGGTQAGSNLFHSFQEFSVLNGGTAFFRNGIDIQNIFSRVTGGSVSNIDGIIRASGTANLFLINPNGIVFGRNASLNIGGSFVATTASAIQFGNQGFFSATVPNTPELLTINPSAFFFNQIAAAAIQNNSVAPAGTAPIGLPSSGLRVPDGRSLLLVGGDINMDGGRLRAYGGRVELGGLAGQGTVGLNFTDKNLSLSFPDSAVRTDVSLTNRAGVNVRADNGGSIAINVQNLNVEEESTLFAGIDTGLGSIRSIAGDIEINATGIIKLSNSSYITNGIGPGAIGKGGSIKITTGSVALTNDGRLQASTFGQGNAGEVNVRAINSVSLAASFILSAVEFGAVGNGGNINISAASLSLTDGSQVTTSVRDAFPNRPPGRGEAGNININVTGAVTIAGVNDDFPSGIRSRLGTGAIGKGGDITITSGSFSLTDGALLITSTYPYAEGNAGMIQINAADAVSISGTNSTFGSSSSLFTSTESSGRGGDITINTRTFSVSEGAVLDTETTNDGNSGNITVNANQVEVLDGGQLLSTTSGNGRAGKITVNATHRMIVNGSDATFNDRVAKFPLRAFVNPEAASGFFVRSQSSGSAGDIEVTSPQIWLDNSGRFIAESTSGNGGNITLQVRDLLLLRRGSLISTTAGTQQQPGDGGNITINAPNGFIVAVPNENSDITANAYTGIGGRVQINTFGIYGIRFRDTENPLTSDITASSTFGADGTVELNTPDIDPNSGLVNLPSVPLDTKLAQGCYSPGYAQSSFIITGRGGLPPNPKDVLSPDAVEVDWVTLDPDTDNRKIPSVSTRTTNPTPERIVEATGWVFNAKGQVEFIADAPTVTPNGSWHNPISCRDSG